MQVNANSTARIAITWNARAKAWEIMATGGDGKRTWVVTQRAKSTVELDRTALMLLCEQIRFALEAWLY